MAPHQSPAKAWYSPALDLPNVSKVGLARLHQMAVDQAEAAASAQRRSQVRTVDRSERIRTYNFPENRIADHRTGYKAYNLDAVINGDLEAVLQSCIQMEEQERLAALGENAG